MNPEIAFWLTLVLFTLTYAGLALGEIPGLRMDRAAIAMVGATLMLVTGLLTLPQAVAAGCIDYKTLLLLFGMMVVVAFLRLSGVFQGMAGWARDRIRSPRVMLAATIATSGLLSAFLINDVVCLALTPLVLHLTRRLRVDPLPHLLALATAANIGSTGTITGNPQNIYIGSHSGIPDLSFALRLLPVALLGLVVNFFVIAILYRRSLTPDTNRSGAGLPGGNVGASNFTSENGPTPRSPRGYQAWLQRKSVTVTLVAVILFFTGLPLELIALGAAAVLLVCRVKPEKVYQQIDWSLLVLFMGLFIVVHAFRVHVVPHWGVERWAWLAGHPVDLLSLASAALSNVVSNVPAVLLMEPIVAAIVPANRETAWLALAMSSTLAGNLTVLGSVANLIVVENARREGISVSFWQYCRVGVPLTLLTLALGIGWLEFVHY